VKFISLSDSNVINQSQLKLLRSGIFRNFLRSRLKKNIAFNMTVQNRCVLPTLLLPFIKTSSKGHVLSRYEVGLQRRRLSQPDSSSICRW